MPLLSLLAERCILTASALRGPRLFARRPSQLIVLLVLTLLLQRLYVELCGTLRNSLGLCGTLQNSLGLYGTL